MSSNSSQSFLSRMKCALSHDWIYFRERGERRCSRCGVEEEYSVDERHSDEDAHKGAKRYRIEDGTLYIERYQVTAWGDDLEEWQWFPVGCGPASDMHLKQLQDEIDGHFSEQAENMVEEEGVVLTETEQQAVKLLREQGRLSRSELADALDMLGGDVSDLMRGLRYKNVVAFDSGDSVFRYTQDSTDSS